MKKLIPFLVLAVALTGCTTAPSTERSPDPKSTVANAEAGQVDDIDELVKAYTDAGGDCSEWEQTDQVEAALASGNCSGSSVLMVFDSESARDAASVTLLGLTAKGETKSILVGPNWIVNADDVFSVLGSMGGDLRTSSELEAAPAPEPTQNPVARQEFSGTGDMVQEVGNVTDLAVVTFSCANCTRNTVLKSNGSEGLLVNEIGAYSGSHAINLYEGSMTTRFEIEAKGSWTLVIDDISTVPSYTSDASGAGDAVFFMSGSFSAAQITNDGESNFFVRAYGTGESPSIVNEIGAYSGVKAMTGPALVQVESSGSWSIVAQ